MGQPSSSSSSRTPAGRIALRLTVAAAVLLSAVLAGAVPAPAPAQAQTAGSPLDLAWSSGRNDRSLAVAWGDYDGDGDLDLAVGNGGDVNRPQPSRIYANQGGALAAEPVWSTPLLGNTFSVAWGDVDNDGDLDLALGRVGPDQLYRNDGLEQDGLTPRMTLSWAGAPDDATRSVAWADYDGDGDLDLATGNLGQPNRLYRNEQGALAITSAWESAEADNTWSLAWGDYDQDGDLDLAAGNGGLDRHQGMSQPSRLYRNDGGALTAASVWDSPPADTHSVAWGDVDNDGDLDLAAANFGQATLLFRTVDGALETTPVWRSPGNPLLATTLAWGDLEGDGDLDLAVGVESGPTRVFRNDGGSLFTVGAVWSSAESDSTTSVAWGDVDNDGDLDLATGAYQQPVRLYRNDQTPLSLIPIGSDRTNALAWEDYDGDGDADLLTGNGGTWPNTIDMPERLYRNDGGVLSSEPLWESAVSDQTTSVAWGDYDLDGDKDLFAANYNQPGRLYRNDGGALTRTPVWETSLAIATSADWGFFNDDPLPDLIVGAIALGSSPSLMLYLNTGVVGAAPTFFPLPISSFADSTSSVLLEDFDRDGDDDLLVGNVGISLGGAGQQSRLYRNDGTPPGGILPNFPQVWVSPMAEATTSAAWGDYDGDGLPDLALANDGQPLRVYRNEASQGGTLSSAPAWSAPVAEASYSVAWADVDGDGYQDLAVGNVLSPNRIYYSRGGVLEANASWSSGFNRETRALAWADVDGDGDLDLAAGNMGWPGRLYRNQGGLLDGGRPWAMPDDVNNYSVAWGDYDGDGDLDLAVGKGAFNNGPNNLRSELYRNSGGRLELDPVWLALESGVATSVAWGDYDGDGDLDLLVGNGGYESGTGPNNQPERLYRNDNGALSPAAVWTSGVDDATYSVAWGDYDGDGDLDLLVGNTGLQPNRLYRNDGGALSSAPVWEAPPNYSTGLAWGDYDQDGDLDFAVSNDGPNQLYRNDGLDADGITPRFTLAWSAQDGDTSWHVAWGDYDGDGDLDLAFAGGEGQGQPNRLYRNDGGVITPRAVFTTSEADLTYGLAWGDVDSDGDLDLAAANGGTFVLQPTRLYRNEGGALTPRSGWQSQDSGLNSDLAWGDYDGDGDADLVTAGIRRPVGIYENRRDGGAGWWPTPSVEVRRPGRVPGAAGLTTPEVIEGPIIPIAFTLRHPQGKGAQRVIGQYSLDGGGSWRPAVAAAGSDIANLAATPSGAAYRYNWDLFASGVFGRNDNVVVRLIAVPALTAGPGQAPGPFVHAAQSAVTPPFRVRGTQVRVQGAAGEPVEGAVVYRIPAGQIGGGPFADGAGAAFRTDTLGFLQGRGTLAIGDSLVALAPLDHTDAYTLYMTSARPVADGLDSFVVRETGVQSLTVSLANPLMLLNLDVSLEWDARGDQQFMEQLRFDLRRASELLYDWTDGQVALGDLRIFQDRERWNDAHIRIYATNRLRPNANQGGIVAEPLADPDQQAIVYEPGQVRIGATWNRYGEAGGSLGEDWPRTLAHELGHFALFLDDNYLGLSEDGRLISIPAEPDGRPCPGAMTDPYRNDYGEFHPAGPAWDADCARTLSELGTGRADWQTIKRFYDRADLGVAFHQPAAFNANTGPSTLPLAVTRVIEPPDPRPLATLASPIYALNEGGSRALAGDSARAFLFRRDGAQRIVGVTDLGRPALDQLEARGARPGDRICVYEPELARLGCEEVRAGDDRLDLGRVDPQLWRPDLRISPETSRTIALDLSGVPAGVTLRAQLFPSFVTTDTQPLELALAPAGEGYTGRFELDTPAPDGLVRVWAEGPGPLREIVADYVLGGNPGFRRSRNAPRGSPGFRRSRNAPAVSADGQVIIFGDELTFADGEFVTVQAATRLPAPPPGRTPFGQGYWLSSVPVDLELRRATINIGYLGRDVPAGAEDGIRMYYWDGARWAALETRLDTERNEASSLLPGPGLFALMTSVDLQLSGPGWNLIAYPVRGKQPVADALVSIAGAYSIVYGYEPGDAPDPWRVFAPGAPPWVSDLQSLEFGKGYWINATEAITLYLPINLQRAATAEGSSPSLPSPPATYYGFAPAAGLTVQARVNGALCGQAQTVDRTINGQPRATFVIKVRGARADAGCGAPGARVHVSVLDGSRELAAYTAPWDNTVVRQLAQERLFLYLPLARADAGGAER
jgi:hypothetical protein